MHDKNASISNYEHAWNKWEMGSLGKEVQNPCQEREKRKEGMERKKEKEKPNGNFITEKHVKPKYEYQWIGDEGWGKESIN